jgi:hypothetical protein
MIKPALALAALLGLAACSSGDTTSSRHQSPELMALGQRIERINAALLRQGGMGSVQSTQPAKKLYGAPNAVTDRFSPAVERFRIITVPDGHGGHAVLIIRRI